MPQLLPILHYPATASPVARGLTIDYPALIAVANGEPGDVGMALADAMVRFQTAGLSLPEELTAWQEHKRRPRVEVTRAAARTICRYAELPETPQDKEPSRFRAVPADAPLCYRSFNDYVADFPEGERYRHWLTKGGRADAYLIRGWGQHRGLPGGYLWASIGWEGTGVFVNDCDDGLIARRCADAAEAQQLLVELCDLAPFTMGNLESFGYRYS